MLALDELEIVVVIDNETDTLSSVDEGVPQTGRCVRAGPVCAKRGRHAVSPERTSDVGSGGLSGR
jgi:hypothetical protein